MTERTDLPRRLVWRKSSYTANTGECVETALLPNGRIVVRDSKDPDGAILSYGVEAWNGFVRAAKHGALKRSRL